MASCSFGLPYVLFVFRLIVILVWFEGGALVLIASVPGHCLSFTFQNFSDRYCICALRSLMLQIIFTNLQGLELSYIQMTAHAK